MVRDIRRGCQEIDDDIHTIVGDDEDGAAVISKVGVALDSLRSNVSRLLPLGVAVA